MTCLLAALLLAAPAPDGGVPPSGISPAELELRAKESAAGGQFTQAAAQFLAVYAQTAEPRLLLYAAECYRSRYAITASASDLETARRYYLDFLRREPTGNLAERARQLVAIVEVELHRLESAVQVPPPQPVAPSGRPVQRPTPRLEPAAPAGPDLTAHPGPARPLDLAASEPTTPLFRRWWPWTAGVTLVTGFVVALLLTRSSGVAAPASEFPPQRF
jgi:hypothetical protein